MEPTLINNFRTQINNIKNKINTKDVAIHTKPTIVSFPAIFNVKFGIFAGTPIVFLIILFLAKPAFIMDEKKIKDTYFTEKHINVGFLIAWSLGFSVVVYIVYFVYITKVIHPTARQLPPPTLILPRS